MTDWFHRDCTEDHCYWLVPKRICQECKRQALKIDPNREVEAEELSDKLEEVFIKNASNVMIPTNWKG